MARRAPRQRSLGTGGPAGIGRPPDRARRSATWRFAHAVRGPSSLPQQRRDARGSRDRESERLARPLAHRIRTRRGSILGVAGNRDRPIRPGGGASRWPRHNVDWRVVDHDRSRLHRGSACHLTQSRHPCGAAQRPVMPVGRPERGCALGPADATDTESKDRFALHPVSPRRSAPCQSYAPHDSTGSSTTTGMTRSVLCSYSPKPGETCFCVVQIRSRSAPVAIRAW